MREYICDLCKETYNLIRDDTWNSFKAAEEMLTMSPEAKNDPTGIICDSCHEEFKKWFSTLTEDEKKYMRKQNAIK